MSAICFHAEGHEARVRGPERAWAKVLCSDMLVAALGIPSLIFLDEDVALYRRLFPSNHYLQRTERERFRDSLITCVNVDAQFFLPSLNTAWVMGSDAVRLLARLHGQCEIHAYVAGPDRAWLAGIIEQGREDGVLRENMGWESVVTLLRCSGDGPVVTSYSVCESFPNAHVAGWESANDGDDWYDLPASEQWNRAVAGLDETLRMDPVTWDDFYFGDGTTGFDLLADIRRAASTPTTGGPEP